MSQKENQALYRQKSADNGQGNSSSMYPVSSKKEQNTYFVYIFRGNKYYFVAISFFNIL